MTHSQQRMLHLAFQLVAVLTLFSFSSAQTLALNDTSPFILLAPDSLQLCTNITLSWYGGNTAPPYRVFLARGFGILGDDSSLAPDELMDSPYETEIYEWLSLDWANVGDVVRFRVTDRDGEGISAFAWSSVYYSACGIDGSGIPRLGNDNAVTSKDTMLVHALTALDAVASLRPLAMSQDRPALSQGSPTATRDPSQVASVPYATGSPGLGGESDHPSQNSSPVAQQASGNPSSSVAGATNNEASAIRGEYTAQPSQTVVPDDDGQSDTTPKQSPFSGQAIGAIVGTLVVAILLWAIFVVWRWRRRRQPLALKPRESPRAGSTQELLSPAIEHSTHTYGSLMAEVSVPSGNLTPPLTPPPISGTTIPSYDEATGVQSSSNTPGFSPGWVYSLSNPTARF